MPTTSLSGWSLANRGPLTTTFTAPATCFTDPTNVLIGVYATLTDTVTSSLFPFAQICDTSKTSASIGDCRPSGRAIDSAYASIDFNNPAAGSTIDYYSPGLICPSGYATVGVGSNNAGNITSSGPAFVPPVTIDSTTLLGSNPPSNVLLQALNPGEQAILCCPESYTVNVYGICYSQLTTYPVPSVGCAGDVPPDQFNVTITTVSIFGTTLTANVYSYITASPTYNIVTIDKSDSDTWGALSVVAPITLVHNAAQATGATASSSRSSATRRRPNRTGYMITFSSLAVAIVAGMLPFDFL